MTTFLFTRQSFSEGGSSPETSSPKEQLQRLYDEIIQSHPLATYGRSKIHPDTGIPYFSLCNGAYLVGYIQHSQLQKKERPWYLYILDYTHRHYVRTGPFRRDSLIKKLAQECERKLAN